MNTANLLGLPHLETGLARVEAELTRAVTSSNPFLTSVSVHLIAAGGKRIRPALALAAASAVPGAGGAAAGAPDRPALGAALESVVVRGACAVELVHLGSLYHDDVIDEAATRRGVDTVNAKWGNLVAIVAGDYLLARASEIAASLGVEVSELLGSTIARLCEGEIAEIETAFDPGRRESDYLECISAKTAALMSASCRIGALCAGRPQPVVDALSAFGTAFGIVFQIVDDVNDLVLSEEQLGKPARDLACGIYTLPVIRALASPGAAADELRALLSPARPGQLGDPEAEKVRKIIRASGGIEAALGVGREYADAAAAAVTPLGPGPVTEGLAGLGHALLDTLTFQSRTRPAPGAAWGTRSRP